MKKLKLVLLLLCFSSLQLSCKEQLINKRSPYLDIVKKRAETDSIPVYRITDEKISRLACPEALAACDIASAESVTFAEFITVLKGRLGIPELSSKLAQATQDVETQKAIIEKLNQEQAEADAAPAANTMAAELATLNTEISDINAELADIEQALQSNPSNQILLNQKAAYKSELDTKLARKATLEHFQNLLEGQEDRTRALQVAEAQKSSSEKQGAVLAADLKTKETELADAETVLKELDENADYSERDLKTMPWFTEVFEAALKTK